MRRAAARPRRTSESTRHEDVSRDNLRSAERSALMARIRSRGTGPERVVRAVLRSLGEVFSTRRRASLGSPDFVIPSARAVIFVHGCFWHRHTCRKGRSSPSARSDFWQQKFERNRRRDAQVRRIVRRSGWKSIVLWECRLRNISIVRQKLSSFLGTTTEKSSCSPAFRRSASAHQFTTSKHTVRLVSRARRAKSSKKLKILR